MRKCRLLAIALGLIVPLAAAGAELEARDYQGIRYVTGGVGQGEVEAMRQLAAEYSLGMTFAARTGQYLAGVKVDITDQSQASVFSAVSDGPMLFANLPRGRYNVTANYQGQTLTRQVALTGEGHRELILHWPLDLTAEPAPGAPPPRRATP